MNYEGYALHERRALILRLLLNPASATASPTKRGIDGRGQDALFSLDRTEGLLDRFSTNFARSRDSERVQESAR
jgi:hypothetical protein